MILLLAVISIAAAAYQLIALAATVRHFSKPPRSGSFSPPVSILKPMRGAHPDLYAALCSQAVQEYPEFEILCGVHDLNDPAVAESSG